MQQALSNACTEHTTIFMLKSFAYLLLCLLHRVPRLQKRPVWFKECLGELVGSALITGVGTAAVASAVTTKETGLLVASVFGWIIAASIACLSHVSGAVFNPAIAIAMHYLQPDSGMTWAKVGRYSFAQVINLDVCYPTS
jgi:Major intrinsic protein